MSIRLYAVFTIVLGAAIAGCSPAPTPTPTPTPAFASEEEAFAAAEETFNQYTEALNAVDTSNPESFEALFDLSSGSVKEADRKNFSSMHADGRVIEGETRVQSFEGVRSTALYDEVVAAVCLDVSSVRITYPDGSSAVSSTRPDIYALDVIFRATSTGSFLVDAANASEDFSCPA